MMPNNCAPANRRYAFPLGAGRRFGRTLHAQTGSPNGGRRGITSIDLNNQNHQPTNQYERSTACRVCHRDNPPGDLGGGMEVDRHVEKRAPQPTGVVYLPRHLQHGGHFAHSLHPALPKDRDANFGGQNVNEFVRELEMSIKNNSYEQKSSCRSHTWTSLRSLFDIHRWFVFAAAGAGGSPLWRRRTAKRLDRSEEHTSELQSRQ